MFSKNNFWGGWLENYVGRTLSSQNRERTNNNSNDNTESLLEAFTAGMNLGHALANGKIRKPKNLLPAICRTIRNTERRNKPPQPFPEGDNDRTPIRFYVDSIFLTAAAQYLLRPRKKTLFFDVVERFHYATGPAVGHRAYAMSHIIKVDFSEQSAAFLRVDNSSNINMLAKLDEWGMPLVAHYHSHPGRGAFATLPSSTDFNFQERLERGGHIAIGGIFSQDGYVRFFSYKSSFQIYVLGNQVKEITKNVYKLSLDAENLPIGNV